MLSRDDERYTSVLHGALVGLFAAGLLACVGAHVASFAEVKPMLYILLGYIIRRPSGHSTARVNAAINAVSLPQASIGAGKNGQ